MNPVAHSALAFAIAAVCELGGCYATWMWLRLDRSQLWLLPGTALLVPFAIALTWVESDFAGRAYAANGGIYIVASLVWGRLVEQRQIDLFDGVGAALCLTGAAVLLFGRHAFG